MGCRILKSTRTGAIRPNKCLKTQPRSTKFPMPNFIGTVETTVISVLVYMILCLNSRLLKLKVA